MLVKTGANNKPRLSPLRCPVRCHKTEAGTVGDERRSKYVDQSWVMILCSQTVSLSKWASISLKTSRLILVLNLHIRCIRISYNVDLSWLRTNLDLAVTDMPHNVLPALSVWLSNFDLSVYHTWWCDKHSYSCCFLLSHSLICFCLSFFSAVCKSNRSHFLTLV